MKPNQDELLMELVHKLNLTYLSDIIDLKDHHAFHDVIRGIPEKRYAVHDWNTLIDYLGNCWNKKTNKVKTVAEAKQYLSNL